MIDEIFLTTEEVLAYLQVNLRTVYRLIKAGKIPAVRVGRQWRFRKSDIDAWLNHQRAGFGMQRTTDWPVSPTPVAIAPAPQMPSGGRPHVLVVDDEESIRDLLSKALSLAEYHVDVVADGPSALQRMRERVYDLLIADLKMPGMDGLTLIREVRRYRANLPVIVITGYSTEANAIEAINLGVTRYLVKPFRIPKVLDAVSQALGDDH
ncbi:MAG: response regulator [Acidobacteriaceae bacterium]|jgi:excisionase family DNA binding protein|nr:response regulator [Acidobacteriaceae bacterium]